MKIIFESKEFHSYSLDLQRKLAKETQNEDLMREIVNSSTEKVLVSLSQNIALTSEILKILSRISNSTIQTNVAKHNNTLPDTLDELAKIGTISTKIAVAENPKTVSDTLNILSYQGDSRILRAIYYNKSTKEKTLERVNAKLESNYRIAGKRWNGRRKFK